MELKPPTRAELEEVRLWRNEILETLRTPYPLTEEMQGAFYDRVVCNSDSRHRYFALHAGYGTFIGLGGLTNIEWENGLAEISLILSPQYRGSGYGRQAVSALIAKGFNDMGLSTIYGECYQCNPAIEFWQKITIENGGYITMIPRRKRWQGQLYDAMHFTIWRQ